MKKNKALVFASVFTLLSTPSVWSSEIYKISPDRFVSALRGFSKEAVEIEDSIPQLGVVIVKQSLNKNTAGWSHLGSSQIIKIEKPVAVAPKKLWGLKSLQIEEAWVQTLGEGVVVAVSDTGIDSDHPDLLENMWVNPREVINDIDDDGNGYVDDIHGWDFVKNKGSGVDHHYHGTHVAGTIGAKIGDKMAGVAPRVKLMDVSFLDAGGSGSDVNGAKTIIYAADSGAKIINCSWGDPERVPLIEEAVLYAQKKGVLVVAAAGNAK
ncbi:MAG: S8 family serine peptidase, partial [Bdellovibrionota bacterium]